MNRAHLREKLHLSGIDSAAAQLSRRYALGFEVTAFCMAAALEDSAAVSAAEAETADIAYVASEECAIRRIAPDVTNVWAPRGGQPVIFTTEGGRA